MHDSDIYLPPNIFDEKCARVENACAQGLALLKRKRPEWEARKKLMQEQGFPAYTTSAGWLGNSMHTRQINATSGRTHHARGWESSIHNRRARVRCPTMREELIGHFNHA